VWPDDVDDEYAHNGRGVNCFSAGTPMCSLCHVVDKCYNAVMATSRDWQVGYKVDPHSLPAAFGYRMWLQEAHRFPAPVVGSME